MYCMTMGGYHRRSFLAALGVSGLLGTAGLASSAGATANSVESSDSTLKSDEHLLGVEVINLETGERTFYSSPDELDRSKLSEGEYEIIEVAREDTQITEQSTQMTVSADTTSEDGLDLRVSADTRTTHSHVDPDGTVSVWAGAVERADDLDRQPAADISLTLTFEDPDGEVVETKSETTDDDGSVRVEFDLSDAELGWSTVRVESEETDLSATASFNVGPYTDVPFHWSGMTVGEETTIGVYSELGGVPESGITRDIVIDKPDGTEETVPLEFQEGGVGLLSFTPQESGSYRFSGAETGRHGRSIDSGELKALAPYFEIRDQYVDETVTWGAHVVDGRTPVSNRELEVTVRDRDTDDTIDTYQPTTNEFGQFTVEFEAPTDPSVEYKIDLETADGTSIFLFGDRVYFDELSEDSAPSPQPPVQLDVSFENHRIGIDTTEPVTIELLEDGDPVENETVSLLFSHTYDDVPAGYTEVETDEEGMATYDVEIPATAPDGERLYVKGIVERDDETYTTTDSVSIEQYDIDIETWGLDPGTTNTLDVTATERATDEPASGIDVTVFGNRYNVDAETFDADYTETNEDGEGQLELDLPEDVTNTVHVNELTPYRSASSSSGSISSPFTADITVTPENPSPGESITVEYTTDTDAAVSAIAVCPSDDGGDLEIIEEGDTGELTVPERIDPGSSIDLQLLLLTEDGEVTQSWKSLSISDELTASFTVSPSDPTVGESVTFESTSTAGPDAPIETVEWSFTESDEFDKEGEEVTYTYDEPGEYEILMQVTDENDETDTATTQIEVTEPLPEIDVTGDGNPATDTTGDGLLDDVNGDGEATIVDVQALFQNLDNDEVQSNAALFDFSGTGDEVTVSDVQALYNQITDSGGDSDA